MADPATPRMPRAGRSAAGRGPTAAVLYSRVSSREQEQQGFSLPAQLELLEAYAKEHGLAVVARFEESETAKAGSKRPAFQKMVEFLRGPGAGAVLLVEKTDRLYRNLRDYLALDDLKVEVHFVREGSVVSPASHSSQRFLHGIKVLMARNYVENLSEEIRKGMREKAREGGFPSAAPLGYLNTDDAVGIVPDSEHGPLVRHLFEKAATGFYSAAELTRLARGLGLRSKKGLSLAKNTICQNVLRNPVYHGTFRWAGTLYEGKYEPLVSKELFDRVQRVLAGRQNTTLARHTFTFNGFVRCGTCGGVLSGMVKKGRYVYYACQGSRSCQRFYKEEFFHDETVRLLDGLRLEDSLVDWLMGELDRFFEPGGDEAALSAARKRLADLQSLRDRAYEDKLLGAISDDYWRSQNTRWQKEADELKATLDAVRGRPSKAEFLRAARAPMELLQVARDQFVTKEPEEKRRLLKTLVWNYTVSDANLDVSMRSPFDVLSKGVETGDWWSLRLEYRTPLLDGGVRVRVVDLVRPVAYLGKAGQTAGA